MSITLVSGPSGSGKSYFAAALACLSASEIVLHDNSTSTALLKKVDVARSVYGLRSNEPKVVLVDSFVWYLDSLGSSIMSARDVSGAIGLIEEAYPGHDIILTVYSGHGVLPRAHYALFAAADQIIQLGIGVDGGKTGTIIKCEELINTKSFKFEIAQKDLGNGRIGPYAEIRIGAGS